MAKNKENMESLRKKNFKKIAKRMSEEDKYQLSEFDLLCKAGYGPTFDSPKELQVRKRLLMELSEYIKSGEK